MKYLFSFFISALLSLLVCDQSNGQITVTNRTNTTPNLAATYGTLALAIADLNALTSISGPVTIKVTASSYTETAPVGGFQIILPNFTNTNSIVIDGDHNATITAFTPQPTGEMYDGIFKIIGADYITIQKFTMQENASNTVIAGATNNMTEWGVALLRSTATNGAQHNCIVDNTISLDRTYPNSWGIYSNVRHTPTNITASDITNVSGSNLGNKVYNNRISNVNMGIAFIGCITDTRMDDLNDIGGTSSSNGNTITNWGANNLVTTTFGGNVNTEYYGILVRNQTNDNVSWNTITSSTSMTGTVAAPMRGIHKANISGTVTGSPSTSIDHNTITVTDNLPNALSSVARLEGILCDNNMGTATLLITNNVVTGLAVTTAGSNIYIRGINNSATVATCKLNGNTVKATASTATASGGWFMGIDQTGSIATTLEINNNYIGDYASTTPAITYSAIAQGATVVRGINEDQSSSNPAGTATLSINGNRLYGFVQPNSSTNGHIYINFDHTTSIASNMHIDGNHFDHITANITGDVTFINSPGTMATAAGAQLSVSNNDIVGSFSKSLAGGDVYLYNASGSSSTGNTMTESGNTFSNISLLGAAVMHGWNNNEGAGAAGPEKVITNNVFDTWTCGTASTSAAANVIYCNWASGNSQISGNSISNITAYSNLNGILSASTTATILDLKGNKISAVYSSNGTLTALNLSGLSATTNVIGSVISTSSFSGPSTNGISTTSGSVGNLNILYNSIYVNVQTSGFAGLITRALTIQGSSSSNPLLVRNNLIINNSITNSGTGSFAAAIYNNGAPNLSNYGGTSNNNVLWAGANPPIAKHYIYYFSATDNQPTISNYISYVQGFFPTAPIPETKSFTVLPDFVSSTDLHLNPVLNSTILTKGDNSTILVPTDRDGNFRETISPYVTDIGAYQITNVWTGTAGSGDDQWKTGANWVFGYPPNAATDNVYIPKVEPSFPKPYISTNAISPTNSVFQVYRIFFQTGLTAGTKLLSNNGLLKITGSLSLLGDDGVFNNFDVASPNLITGSIELNASTDPLTSFINPQSISGRIFASKEVNDFTATNNVSIVSGLLEGLRVAGKLSFGAVSSNTITTNGTLTLVSSINKTAMVTAISNSNNIAGDVTVERYCNTGIDPTTPAQHRKSWQFLATPTVGQTIFQSWQEAGIFPAAPNGYGTYIVGNGTGFDQTTSTASVEYWDPYGGSMGTGDWVDITNTGQALYDQRGYQILVRGDRFVTAFGQNPNPTILRSTGTIFEPLNAPPVTTVSTGAGGIFTSVGNPYASPIDLNALVSAGFSNVSTDVYVWDPLLMGSHNLGDYQFLDGTDSYKPVPGGTDFYPSGVPHPIMQSGQAFFVTPAGSGTGLVTFTEGVKSTGDMLVNRSGSMITPARFAASLYTDKGIVAAGNAVAFDDHYSNRVDSRDIVKFPTAGESFVIVRENKSLVREARSSICETDSVFYNFTNLQKQQYQLRFYAQRMNESGLNAYLVDNYKKTTTLLSLTDSNFVDFVVDDNKSSYENRFMVVFSKGLDNLVKANNENDNGLSLVVSPNPVENKTIRFQLAGMGAGSYSVKLINQSGQLIYNGNVQTVDKTTTQTIKLVNNTATGSYELVITSTAGKKWSRQVIIK